MNILVVAPHADDEILGVGATMAKYIAEGHQVFVCIATRPTQPIFNDATFDVIRSETKKAHKYIGIEQTIYLELPAVMVENVPRHELNQKIMDMVRTVKPDIIYIPHFGDMQKDHQIIAEAMMVAVRPNKDYKIKKVYAYETLSETEWNVPHVSNVFMPNTYIDISEFIDNKLCAMTCFKSQLKDFPNPRSLVAIESLARYRGSTIQTIASEAFMLIREIG